MRRSSCQSCHRGAGRGHFGCAVPTFEGETVERCPGGALGTPDGRVFRNGDRSSDHLHDFDLNDDSSATDISCSNADHDFCGNGRGLVELRLLCSERHLRGRRGRTFTIGHADPSGAREPVVDRGNGATGGQRIGVVCWSESLLDDWWSGAPKWVFSDWIPRRGRPILASASLPSNRTRRRSCYNSSQSDLLFQYQLLRRRRRLRHGSYEQHRWAGSRGSGMDRAGLGNSAHPCRASNNQVLQSTLSRFLRHPGFLHGRWSKPLGHQSARIGRRLGWITVEGNDHAAGERIGVLAERLLHVEFVLSRPRHCRE